MKQETKQTIDWIKKQINLAKENCIDPCHKDGYPEYKADYDNAMKVLDSLPDEERETLKIHQNGMVEVELRTITDGKLQFNDLVIQYYTETNVVAIAYDIIPKNILYTFRVIKKGEKVKFKARNEVGIFARFPGLRIFDIENMELI